MLGNNIFAVGRDTSHGVRKREAHERVHTPTGTKKSLFAVTAARTGPYPPVDPSDETKTTDDFPHSFNGPGL